MNRIDKVVHGNHDHRRIESPASHSAFSLSNRKPKPTQHQIKTGLYRKGHLSLHGLKIAIESPKGSIREGLNPDGTKWQSLIRDHYGYIKGTVANDNDPVDVFIGYNALAKNAKFHIITQTKDNGRIDEPKVMIGYINEFEAKRAYLSNYDIGWSNFRSDIQELSSSDFKVWLQQYKKKG